MRNPTLNIAEEETENLQISLCKSPISGALEINIGDGGDNIAFPVPEIPSLIRKLVILWVRSWLAQ